MNEQISGAGRFGRAAQEQAVTSQRVAAGSNQESCAVIVITSPVLGTDHTISISGEEIPVEHKVNDKAVQRLTDMLYSETSAANPASAYSILMSDDVQVAIDERFVPHTQGSSSVILHFTVNMSVREMYSRLSLEMFAKADGDSDLNDTAANYGIHAVAITTASDAVRVTSLLKAQLQHMLTDNRIVPFTSVEGELPDSVIDWSVVSGERQLMLVLEGVASNFIFVNPNGELFAVVSKESTVGAIKEKAVLSEGVEIDAEEFDDADEVDSDVQVTGADLFSYKAESLSTEKQIEALSSLGYDCSEMEPSEVLASFQVEQTQYLETVEEEDEEESDLESEEEDESDSAEEDDEDDPAQEDAAEDEEEESFSFIGQVQDILIDAELDRDDIKRVARLLELKVVVSDTAETLLAKVNAALEEANDLELAHNVLVFAAEELELDDAVDLLSDAGEEEEAEEEESEDDSALSYFDHEAGELTPEQRVEALQAAGFDATGNLIVVMRKFRAAQEQYRADQRNGQEAESDDEEEDDDFLARVCIEENNPTPEDKVTAIHLIIGEQVQVTDPDLDEYFQMALTQYSAMQADPEQEEADSEEEEEDEAEGEEVSNSDLLRDIFGEEELSRQELKRLVIASAIRVVVSDTPESLTNKLYDHVDGLDKAEFFRLCDVFAKALSDLNPNLAETFESYNFNFSYAYSKEAEEFDDRAGYEEDAGKPYEDAADEDGEVEDEDDADEVEEDSAFLTDVEHTPAGTLASVVFDQKLIINFVLSDRASFEDIAAELADINGVDYRYPFNPGTRPDAAQGSMYLPLSNIVETMEDASISRFMADPATFDVNEFGEQLATTLRKQVADRLYEDRLPDGANPEVEGVIVGDFVDDEDMEDFHIEDDGYTSALNDALPIAQLYNADIHVRPVSLDDANVLVNVAVVNFMVPGFWANDVNKIEKLLQSACNQVRSRIADATDIEVYAAFTIDSSTIMSDDNVFEAVAALRQVEHAQVYSANDVAQLEDNDDMIAAASTLADRDLPLTILCSHVAGHTFSLGGDLTVLIPCFDIEEEEEEDLDDEE
ncbi:hypothetical protein fHeYen902_221 [Yersinia phage fHe-Yen9-02]|nr:hypothetical protein fHeYen902_221 [Yersinia phage fHe-Yen9-02]